MRRFAFAISSADIWAKSLPFRTSRSETVRRAENSVSSLGGAGSFFGSRRQGLGDPQGAGLRLLLLLHVARRDRRHLGDELLDQRAPPPEDPEGLVEEQALLVALHEHGVQRPVEVLPRADPRRLDGGDRVETAPGPTGRPAARSARAK